MKGFFSEAPFPNQQPIERPDLEKEAKRGDVSRRRALFIAAFFAIAFGALGYRMGALALNGSGEQRSRVAEKETPRRAQILDRHGRVLASTLQTWQVALRPNVASQTGGLSPDSLYALGEIFPKLDINRLRRLVDIGETKFTFVERRASPRQWKAARDLGIIGLEATQRSDRVYPPGRVAAHILGGVDIDNKGVSGVERGLEDRLTDPESNREPLRLSIDLRVQNALHITMSEAVAQYAALASAGMVMDVRTGELLAMVSLPDFDPNNRPEPPRTSDPIKQAASPLFNRVTQGSYELGSVFKLITAAAALETGVAELDTPLDARFPLPRGGYRISDYLGKGRVMSLDEVIRYSSNIGAVRIADLLGVEKHQAFFDTVGISGKVPLAEIPGPELSAGQLPQRWGSTEAATVSYGHGISVSPLHVATAMASITNYGCKVTPTLLRRDPDPTCERVVSKEVSGKVRALMRTVGKLSSGRNANIAGYEIGGKTGTAYKVDPRGGYDLDKRFNTFLALWPTTEPQYMLMLSLDDPKLLDGTSRLPLAGRTAAIAAGRAIERIAPLLGLAPTDRFRPSGLLEEITEAAPPEAINLPPLTATPQVNQ